MSCRPSEHYSAAEGDSEQTEYKLISSHFTMKPCYVFALVVACAAVVECDVVVPDSPRKYILHVTVYFVQGIGKYMLYVAMRYVHW